MRTYYVCLYSPWMDAEQDGVGRDRLGLKKSLEEGKWTITWEGEERLKLAGLGKSGKETVWHESFYNPAGTPNPSLLCHKHASVLETCRRILSKAVRLCLYTFSDEAHYLSQIGQGSFWITVVLTNNCEKIPDHPLLQNAHSILQRLLCTQHMPVSPPIPHRLAGHPFLIRWRHLKYGFPSHRGPFLLYFPSVTVVVNQPSQQGLWSELLYCGASSLVVRGSMASHSDKKLSGNKGSVYEVYAGLLSVQL